MVDFRPIGIRRIGIRRYGNTPPKDRHHRSPAGSHRSRSNPRKHQSRKSRSTSRRRKSRKRRRSTTSSRRSSPARCRRRSPSSPSSSGSSYSSSGSSTSPSSSSPASSRSRSCSRSPRRHKTKHRSRRSRSRSNDSARHHRSRGRHHHSRGRRHHHSSDRPRRHRSHHRSHHRGDKSLVTCVAPLPRHIKEKIVRGEYVSFCKLLPHTEAPPFAGTTAEDRRRRRSTTHPTIQDRNTWLEAWNQFLGARLSHDPSLALELVKYQTILTMLFKNYAAAACLEYDRLFRQAAARDTSIRWDTLKEDIFVWALTLPTHAHPARLATNTGSAPQPFRNPAHARDGAQATSTSRAGPNSNCSRPNRPRDAGNKPTASSSTSATDPRSTHTSTGTEICRRFNWGSCTSSNCVYAHSCWTLGCGGVHPATGCPKRPQ